MNRLRRQTRIPLNARVKLLWTGENGQACFCMAQAVNISESGLRLESDHAVPLRSYVNFQVENSDVQGSASVRSCRHQGMKYCIGLEFTGGLRWESGSGAAQTGRWQ
ncbi:MAG: PilZ domain-containing protein [Bryobacterales bacterium]|nr:PilZ domain-containing protein [Bryobacterales bacterium]